VQGVPAEPDAERVQPRGVPDAPAALPDALVEEPDVAPVLPPEVPDAPAAALDAERVPPRAVPDAPAALLVERAVEQDEPAVAWDALERPAEEQGEPVAAEPDEPAAAPYVELPLAAERAVPESLPAESDEPPAAPLDAA